MVDLANAIAVLEFTGSIIEPCGSRVTCNPPPTDTDRDFLVVVQNEDTVPSIVSELSRLGFHWEGDVHYQTAASDGFMSWRSHDVNFIVTASADFARRHRSATALCTRLNLMGKQDRIALFQAVLYGNQWDGVGETPKEPAHKPAIKDEELPW